MLGLDKEEMKTVLEFHVNTVSQACYLIKNCEEPEDRYASKHVSMIYFLEIVVRDCRRFRHFLYGICSRGNHWKLGFGELDC